MGFSKAAFGRHFSVCNFISEVRPSCPLSCDMITLCVV